MSPLPPAIGRFLSARRIAVAGVSHDSQIPANLIYKKLRSTPTHVFAINPHATKVEGDTCYPDLASVPGGVEAVVIATPPGVAETLVRQCMALGIGQIWMHRAFGAGSVSAEAVRLARDNGITVIDGACPMMYVEPVDFGHRCFRGLLSLTGRLPQAARA